MDTENLELLVYNNNIKSIYEEITEIESNYFINVGMI